MSETTILTDALFSGDADALLAVMIEDPGVQDQRMGELRGPDGVARWVRESAVWLEGLRAEATLVAELSSRARLVCEFSLTIHADDGAVDLPYVIVADRSEAGLSELRTYHSTWPYTGGHVFRAPPLAGREPEAMPEIFAWYIDRVSSADVAAVLARFTEDGYVREPSGDRWRHQGVEGRAAFYGHLEHAPRATFDLMTATTDGDLIAVEYAFSYGDTDKVGGVCVMETRGDLVHAVRITDDVSV